MKHLPGKPFPLGATYDGQGTNFSVFSEIAESVELCLFDGDGNEKRIELVEHTGFRRHCYIPDLGPGQHYGFRVHGPWEPSNGHFCCSSKLLFDPYARAIGGDWQWGPPLLPFDEDNPDAIANNEDSAPHVPKSVVINQSFDWQDDASPKTPLQDTVIYELHVKGFTWMNPDIPEELRGTYAGLAHPASIEYLRNLGITAVELMPVHQFVHNGSLLEKGLRNYWGYDTICFLAPHNEYSSSHEIGGQVTEFKSMVKQLHAAGLEVILDVVYNHTAEGDPRGPMLCFRGMDNISYYRVADDKRYYVDYTGTGNSLNMRHPFVLQLIMDSLRYWILEMHVDGFRFDEAAALARELHDVDRLSSFFEIIQQDPVISQVKLIAEPWDVGEGGYQVGRFPPHWSEWNGKYRDCVRDYWRGKPHILSEFASRFTGSSDLYEDTARRPVASINYVACHDGFCLHDLVSYEEKHNEDNQEDSRDGVDDNRSCNHGVEGQTDDEEILRLRERQKLNFMATLFLSQGVPMLFSGDEIGHTKRGNNNSYCQDNEINWLDWPHADEGLLKYVSFLISFRRKHPVFHRRKWFHGFTIMGAGIKDIAWYTQAGGEMTESDWKHAQEAPIAIFFAGELGYPDSQGNPIKDDDFFVLLNPFAETHRIALPSQLTDRPWRRVIDTSVMDTDLNDPVTDPENITIQENSIMVLQSERT